MLTQTDLFNPADDEIDFENTGHGQDKKLALTAPIAVPCGFRDRSNAPCKRLGNWPIMSDGKQMVCRNRPMVHCDPACFKGEAPAQHYGTDDDDIVWEDRVSRYDDQE